MLKRKREEKQTELKEKFDSEKEIKIKRDTISKLNDNYYVELKHQKDTGLFEDMIKKYNFTVLTIIFNMKDSNFLKNIPSQITRLRLMSHFNYPIDNIPDTIEYLEFSTWFNQKITKLPKNLTHLEFGNTDEDIQRINSFPETLVYLKMPKYPHDLDNLPSGLKQLVVGKVKSVSNLPNKLTHITINSDISIDDIPESIEYLNLEDNFNHPLENLPRNLKRLTLGINFNLPLINLPDNLEELEISDGFNQPIYNLPSNLKVLKLGNKFNSKIYSMGDKLEHIRFGLNYELDFDMLPVSLKRIDKVTNIYLDQNVIKKNKVFGYPLPVDKFFKLLVTFDYHNYEEYQLAISVGNEIFNIEINPIIKKGPHDLDYQECLERYSGVFETENYSISVKGKSIGYNYNFEFKKIFKNNKK